MSPTLKSTGGGSLPNLGGFHWSSPIMFGSAESEHPRLTNGEIIADVFQTMWSQSTNVTDRQTDDRNTALCTKVHRAVKMVKTIIHWAVQPISTRTAGAFAYNTCERQASCDNLLICNNWSGQDAYKSLRQRWMLLLLLWGTYVFKRKHF